MKETGVNDPGADIDTSPAGSSEELKRIIAALASARRTYLARGALSVVLTAALALLSFLILLNRLVPGWRPLPLFSFLIFWSGIAAAVIAGALRRVLPPRSAWWLTDMIGRRAGRGSFYSAAFEFSRAGERHKPYSPYLMAETVRRAGEELRGMSPGAIFSGSGRPGWTLAGLLVGLVLAYQVTIQGAGTSRILAAVCDPAIYFRRPQGFNLVVTTGDYAVLEGENVVTEAVKFGSMRGDATLRVSSIPGVWKRMPLEPDTAMVGDVAVTTYRRTFENVREDFSYYFEAGEEQTGRHMVTVMHRPVINRISAMLKYPAYTGAEPETIATLAGRIVVLSGTHVELEGETSKELREGWLDFARGGRSPLSPVEGGFEGSFSAAEDDTFTIEVSDSMGLTNDGAIRYPVISLEDGDPVVELLAPDDESMLARNLSVGLLYRAGDDYGVSRVVLRFRREGKEKNYRSIAIKPFSKSVTREIEGDYHWSLKGMEILPGDEILYYIEVFDNNTLTGPGYARTDPRRLLVPTLSEIYAGIREEENLQREGMHDVLERGREIKERLKTLSDDLKAERELDWSRRREGKEIVKKQSELQEQIRKAAGQIDRTLQALERNMMTSQEIGEKMEKIQSLLNDIESEDLKEAIENFRRMLSEVSEDEMVSAMNEMELSAEDLVNRLDRTIELLKQVLKEERMEEFVRRMEEMLDEQRALRDSLDTGERDDLSERQDQLGDEVDRFGEDLGEFSAQEGDSSLASDIEDILEEMNEPDLEKMMKQAAREIQGGDKEQAGCTQNDAVDRMLSLYTSLGRCQMSMSIAIESEVLEMIERSTRELVEVSKLEEDFMAGLRSRDAVQRREELITEQLVLKEAVRKITEDLYRAARKAMMLSDGVFIHIGAAYSEIETALGLIEEEKINNAAAAAGRTCMRLNRAVIELLRSSSSSGGSCGGGAREGMQVMLQRQHAIDEQLRRMLGQGKQGSWSMEERAGMARLAAEQRKMEELLRQIADESMGTGELLGRLDDIAGDMKEVAGSLEEGELDDRLLEREERILSRMLESQRSIQRRDYKRERVSTGAGDVRARDPGELEGGLDEAEVLLRMIRRGMQEKGPAEYEELIRLYFRALSKKVREKR